MKEILSRVLHRPTNVEFRKCQRVWKGTCPICGRFQNSVKVCGECVDDGLDLRITPIVGGGRCSPAG